MERKHGIVSSVPPSRRRAVVLSTVTAVSPALFAAACAAPGPARPTSDEPPTFSLQIETSLVEGGDGRPALRAVAVLRNTTNQAITIRYGACALNLRAYRTADRAGEPVWRSEYRAPWDGTFFYGCPGYLASSEVGAGAEFSPHEFQLVVPLIEIVGDSLPDQRYYFSGVLSIDGDTLHAPAGDALLSVTRPALPESLTFGAITFTAATEVLQEQPTILRTSVTARLTHASGTVTRISASCPVILLAYRSRRLRETAPRTGVPDAQIPRACEGGLREIVFSAPDPRASARPGEPFPGQQPGPPVVFSVETTAAELLPDDLPEGRYFFVVAVPMERRTIYLGAGEAEIRR